MDRIRGIVIGVTVVIVVTTLLSGPLVPGITLAEEPEPRDFETGNVTVSAVKLPDTATLERGSYGSENYNLKVPPTTVRFANLEGNPTLAYRLTINAFNYSRVTNHFLSESTGDTYVLTMQSDTFTREEIRREEYSGSLTIIKRDDAGDGVVANRNITIEVVE